MDIKNALYKYLLRLGDSNLILGQRLSELTFSGPTLEETIALTNISLDLFGQANHFLELATEIIGEGTPDSLAFERNEREYFNSLLAEMPNGDFAQTITRQFFIDTYNYHLYTALGQSSNDKIAALAQKSIKEVSYHLKHSSAWVIRLGDGTEESTKRMQKAIELLWRYTDDLFQSDDVDVLLKEEGISTDLEIIKKQWLQTIEEVFKQAKLKTPSESFFIYGSREGIHTEHLGHLLTEMQYMHRLIPGAKW